MKTNKSCKNCRMPVGQREDYCVDCEIDLKTTTADILEARDRHYGGENFMERDATNETES